MEELSGDDLFEKRLEQCHVLESLAITLEKMLEGSYISSNTANKIMKEASNQYHNLLKYSKFCLPSHYVIGHLKHYKQSEYEWIFSVANPVISLCVPSNGSGGRPFVAEMCNDLGNYEGARTTSNMSLNAHSGTFCYPGIIKIRAITDGTEVS
ncbi:hypothetical protein BgAZ_109870 [Babesia gibsoni]|uniref:Uncharacterized protein n=1 Tax=Babesia gibsoni TaxID=33632 RepID=A0AAD8PGS2_BABGI|nr:hypothetical protein BgAZ_109870 [Babesia gibsoni]